MERIRRKCFGGWNYSSLPGESAKRERFYREQARTVRAFCQRHQIRRTTEF